MTNNLNRYCVTILVFVCLCSCNQKEVYYEFSPIPQNQWSKSNQICFDLDSIDINPLHKYTINVEILHNVNYAYETLWLYLDHTLENNIVVHDTLECVLTNEKGKWLGYGNGPTRQVSVIYDTGITMDTTIHNQICIRQAMQDFQLKGIEKVGVKIY